MSDSWLDSIFGESQIEAPDYIIAPALEREMDVLQETRENGQRLSGCYLWIDSGSGVTFLYAGKASRLKNRIQTHLDHSAWMWRYWDMVFSGDHDDLAGVPLVCVWLTDERASLESKLIDHFSPIFNRRHE